MNLACEGPIAYLAVEESPSSYYYARVPRRLTRFDISAALYVVRFLICVAWRARSVQNMITSVHFQSN